MAQTFLILPQPLGGSGPGAAVAIPAASPHKTFLVGGQWATFPVILEVSADGVHWDGVASYGQQNQPPKNLMFSANWARCNIRGPISGTPVVALAVDTVAEGAIQAAEIPINGVSLNVSAYENKHKTFLVSASEANRNGVLVIEGSANGGTTWEPLFSAQGQDRDAPYNFDGYLDFVRVRRLRGATAGMRVDIVTEPFDCGEVPVLACVQDELPFDGDIGNVWVEGPPLAVARQEIVSALTHEGSQYRAMFAGGRNVGNPNGVANVDAYTWAALPGIAKDNAFATPMQIDEYGIAPHAITLEDCPVVIPTPSFGGDEPLLEAPSLYDPDTNTWSLGNQPGSSEAQFNRGAWGAQILLVDGTILVMNAGGNPTASIYNPATDAWSSPVGSNSPTYAYGSGFAAIRLANGSVLVCGGVGDSESTVEATIYNPTTNLWSAAASMNQERENHGLVLLDDGRVLAIAGQQGSPGDLNVWPGTEIYDPVANTWTATGFLNAGRYNFGASKLPNGDVIVVGGSGNFDPLITAEIYDVAAGTWSYGPYMSYTRNGVAGALVAMPDADQAGLIVAGGFGRQLAMTSVNADLNTVEYLTIGSFFPFGRIVNALSAFLNNVAEEQIEAPSPGDPGYFTCAINWDDLPGDMVRAIFSSAGMSVTGTVNEQLIIKVYAGGVPPSNNPGAIVGTNIMEMALVTGSVGIRYKGGMYFPKPTGRSTLITTWRTSTGGNVSVSGDNPILTVQTRVLGESALLLVGAPIPSTTVSTQPNAWVVNFDLFDTPTITVSMSGFTRTAIAAASANIAAQIDGDPAVPSGTTIASYSLIGQQSPLDEWQITGSTVVISNPGGLRHLKLAPTGDAATEIRNMSVIIRAVSP